MALTFALTTSAIVAIYGLWSTYIVLDTTRNDLRAFIEHELEELALSIERSSGSPEEIQRCVDDIATVTEEPGCRFRVRAGDGSLIADAGAEHLAHVVPEAIRPNESWRRWFFERRVAVGARRLAGEPGRPVVEVIVDAQRAVAAIHSYLGSALFIFLGSVGLAALAGWWTAHRGLRSLREVVDQARDVSSPAEAPSILLHGAPVEVREVGEAMNAMLARIRTGIEEMRTFTASLAHELRSPLQNLIGETEVMLLAERPAEAYQRLLRSNLEDLYDLSDAVDNIVAWCRTAEPDRPPLQAESFDLAEEAELRLGRERRTAQRAGVELVVDVEGDTRLDADREAVLRVVRNLVGNALAWSAPGTTVDVDFIGDERGVRVEVADRGPGVPEALGERIFEPFVSGPPREGRRGGYGLGLAICRSVMRDHGGTLQHEAREGGGTRFTAFFPRQAAGSLATV
jgi:two-component system heavy metal sensor histidine kinase CusS